METSTTVQISLASQIDYVREQLYGSANAYGEAILKSLQELKALREAAPAKSTAPAVAAVPGFNEDAIGNAIRLKVDVQASIHELEFLVQGSNHPENIAGYQEQLMHKRKEMEWINASLRDLKKDHIAHLEQRLRIVDIDIEINSDDAFTVAELESLKRDLQKKIAIINTELQTI